MRLEDFLKALNIYHVFILDRRDDHGGDKPKNEARNDLVNAGRAEAQCSFYHPFYLKEEAMRYSICKKRQKRVCPFRTDPFEF